MNADSQAYRDTAGPSLDLQDTRVPARDEMV